MNLELFKHLKFKYPFYKHQNLILEKFNSEYKASLNNRLKFHVIAPPGSGKTIVGLEIAIRLMTPTVVLCPNTAIQGQWEDKLNMFIKENTDFEKGRVISTDVNEIKLINVFTYQALSLPNTSDELIDAMAENMWADTISQAHGINNLEALARIYTMQTANPKGYKEELSKFTKKIRYAFLEETEVDFQKLLHPNTRDLINILKDKGIKTIIFDECHHLQSYWAKIMSEIINYLDIKNVIGLTATPPLSEDNEKFNSYTSVLGEFDYMVPTPAIVKEGMLAPYQDMVYICQPKTDELEFIKNCHAEFNKIIEILDNPEGDFYFWIVDRIINRKLITGESQEWGKFISSRPRFAVAGIKYLLNKGYKIPWSITITENMYKKIDFDDWCELIEDFALHFLKVSKNEEHHLFYNQIKQAVRNMGYVLTEKGIRTYSSPMDRILAYSKSKLDGIKSILSIEMKNMKEDLRVAIVTDFEYSNSIQLKKAENIFDNETGGSISVIKYLTSDEETDKLDPIMVTSKNLICDDDIAETYVQMGHKWASDNKMNFTLTIDRVDEKFTSINGSGKDWNSKTAVMFTTYLLELGVTKCIIGTRGLLGEGWDSLNLNTLIDLTTVTTFASVNQLRGRSIRKSKIFEEKLANNWDVICIAPGLEKGYNDLKRLYKEHDQFYGLCEDGQIEKGINHISSSFIFNDDLNSDTIIEINTKMIQKAANRKLAYDNWNVNKDFTNVELGCCELKLTKPLMAKDPNLNLKERFIFNIKLSSNVLKTIAAFGGIYGAVAIATTPIGLLGLGAGSLLLGYSSVKGFKKTFNYGEEKFINITSDKYIKDFATCILFALMEINEIRRNINSNHIKITTLDKGTIRVILEGDERESQIFSNALAQLLEPIEDQRYAIQRYEVEDLTRGMGKFINILRYGQNRYDSLLSCYHPLPKIFDTKEKARIFQKYWNTYVSPGEIVFLKGKNGIEVIEKYGRINSLGSIKQTTTVWK